MVSIAYVGYGRFYDLSVPGPEHYEAEGLVHHNSGKSTLASTIASVGKTLFIDLVGEKGTRSFRGAPYAENITVMRPNSVQLLDDIFWELNAGRHDFKAVVVDSLTSVQKMAMRFILGYEETSVKEIRRGTAPADQRSWGQTLDIMTDMATYWYGLADGDREKPLHVVMTAQTKVTDDDFGNTHRVPDVQRGALSIVLASPDYILFTDVEENVDAIGDETKAPVRHVVRFGSDPEYRIKARVPYDMRGKIPPILGRKTPLSLVSLGRQLGIGGMPPAKKRQA